MAIAIYNLIFTVVVWLIVAGVMKVLKVYKEVF